VAGEQRRRSIHGGAIHCRAIHCRAIHRRAIHSRGFLRLGMGGVVGGLDFRDAILEHLVVRAGLD
jgi:hypothetical protein